MEDVIAVGLDTIRDEGGADRALDRLIVLQVEAGADAGRFSDDDADAERAFFSGPTLLSVVGECRCRQGENREYEPPHGNDASRPA